MLTRLVAVTTSFVERLAAARDRRRRSTSTPARRLRRDRLAAYLAERSRRAAPARRRGARLPRDAHLGHSADLRAPAHRHRTCGGDRDDRPARCSRSSESRATSSSGTSCPRTRAPRARTDRRRASEIEAGAPFLAELSAGRRAIAVGRVAHARLGGPYVRHPSHGGAAAFRAGLAAAISRLGRGRLPDPQEHRPARGHPDVPLRHGPAGRRRRDRDARPRHGHRGDPGPRPGDLPHRPARSPRCPPGG